MTDRGACADRRYLERGQPVTVLLGWRGPGPRNVLIERSDGRRTVRPFRGLRRALHPALPSEDEQHEDHEDHKDSLNDVPKASLNPL